MEIDDMKTIWQNQKTAEKEQTALKGMKPELSHPVLKKIRRQLLIEMALWTVIVALYHSAFDGDKRPGAVNLVFVVGFMQAIAYNLSGYLAARNLQSGTNLISSLNARAKQLQKLKWAALASRTVLMGSILFYFAYDLEIDGKRMLSISAIVIVFALQLVWLHKIWAERINKITQSADLLAQL